MRTVHYLAAAGAACVTSLAVGEPLDRSAVSEEAKWVAHVDLEAFKDSSIGQFFLEMGIAAMEQQNPAPVKVDLEMVLEDLKSVTAYGYEFQDKPEENSAIIVRTGDRLRAIVDALIASEEVTKGPESQIKAVEGKPFPTYLLGGELYVSIPGETLFVGSKSYAQIERAMDVLRGSAPSLENGSSKLVRGGTEGFFFFASANGLNTLEGMPPQARILQQATGAQISLGEMGSELRSQLVLSTENATVSDQLYRIIQGMLALVSFAQVENESLSTIVRNARVERSPEFVSVDLSYPSEGILKIVEPLIKGEGKVGTGGHDHSKKPDESAAEAVVEDGVGGEELRVLNVDARSDNGNLPRHAVDGDPETYWGSSGRGQWIRFELASHSLVRELQIAWRRGDERRHRFTVQTSPDGVAWEKVIDRISSGATADFESFNIPDTATKWLRLWCNANTVNPMNTISEIRFLGESSYVIPLSEGVTE